MSAVARAAPSRGLWRPAAAWLVVLSAFFYASYGFANWLADRRADVPSIVFAWERHIPFLAWTVVPYWSINLLYAASLFLCRDRDELALQMRRLLTCQIVAVACFILFPLQLAVARPETSGISGFLFEALAAFDKPYNLAPSLHAAILLVLWDIYARHAPRALRAPLHLWFALIGVSVLTTYQHHFIDLPTGILLGAFTLWLWPRRQPTPLARLQWTTDRRRGVLAACYALGAGVFTALAFAAGGLALWLLWPAASLLLVAAAYAAIGPRAFQKDGYGRLGLAARLLLAPYLAGARLNAWLWTRDDRAPAEVAGGVFIGPLPARAAGRFGTILDLTAELEAPGGSPRVRSLPCLDLVAPAAETLDAAADAIERARSGGTVLVACALGYGRSAAAVAHWLLRSGRAADEAAALAMLRKARPRIRLRPDLKAARLRIAAVDGG